MENRTLTTNFTPSSYEIQDLTKYWKRIDMTNIVCYIIYSVLGTVGNGVVIFITGFRMKKTVYIVCILNLAIADFAFNIFLPFSIVSSFLGPHWSFGRTMCKLHDAIIFLNLYASIYTITVISIYRCISVRCPIWAQNHQTPRLAYFVILGVWILAVLLCSPYLYFKDVRNVYETNSTSCLYNFGSTGAEKMYWHIVVPFHFIFGFIIPFCVIVVCYGAIVVRLKRGHLSQSSKPFKVITAVIVAFFVCWFPFHLFSLFSLKMPPGSDPKNLVMVQTGHILSYNLAFFNSSLNPILYFCMGHNFKGRLRCSLFSALANAFTEDSNLSNKKTSNRSTDLDTHNL